VKYRIILALILVAIFSGAACQGCKNTSADTEDPLKKMARQRYAEGRRLFLTCDPNNFPAALKAYEDALSSWDDYPEALASWAETVSMWYGFRMSQEIFEQAYVRAQRAIRLAPDNDMGYRAMADLFRHYHDPETGKLANDEAMKSIERALSINPNSAENLYVKGSIMLASDPEGAIKVFEQALRLNRDLAKIYFNLASAYQMVGDKVVYGPKDPDPAKQAEREKAADANYLKAIKLLGIYQHMVPDDLGGYTSLATIYLHQKNYVEAEKALQQAVSQNLTPDPSQTQWRGQAYVYLAQIADQYHHDLKLSRTYLERALNANPYDPQIYQQLIRIAEIQKDSAGASQYEQQYKDMAAKVHAEMAAQQGSTVEAEEGATAEPEAGGTASPAPAAGTTTAAGQPAAAPGATAGPTTP